eukprot:TRINITY_DN16074_c0_g1_i1.p1 TRINITY_DN16074_c0_g1~~TRINITY_DN16074_c0_g1_i1.p1  ORF type:complete len:130 (-),score=14.84 TRINITY_DN16074_c0_g1_i1:330-719(-)
MDYNLDKSNIEITSIRFRDIMEKDINRLKKLHENLFPVKYSDEFFKGLFRSSIKTVICEINGTVMGFATSKIKIKKNICGMKRSITGYIMTIGVSNRIRRLGIGCKILDKMLEVLQKKIVMLLLCTFKK